MLLLNRLVLPENCSVRLDLEYDDFEIEDKVVGEGGFGSVRLARVKQTGQVFVIKEIDVSGRPPLIIDLVLNEIQHLCIVSNCPFICPLFAVFEYDSSIYMVQDMCGDDLITVLFNSRRTDITLGKKLKWFKQVVSAIECCHARKILHLDIKLENVLINPTTDMVKVIDFGLSQFEEQLVNKRSGTTYAMAPELLAKKQISKATDYWALGVLLYIMVMARKPFDVAGQHTLSRRQYIHHMYLATRSLKYNYDDLPDIVKPIIANIFVIDPEKRWTPSEILKYLKEHGI